MTYSKTSRAVRFSTGSWPALPTRLPGFASAAVPGAAAITLTTPSSWATSSASSMAACEPGAGTAFAAYSMRKGPVSATPICACLASSCRLSGVVASAQSMRRSAPCASVNDTAYTLCSSSKVTSLTALNCQSRSSALRRARIASILSRDSNAARRVLSTPSLAKISAKARVTSSLRMRLLTLSKKPR